MRRSLALSGLVVVVVGFALAVTPLQAVGSLSTSWQATQRWVSSIGSKTVSPIDRVGSLLSPHQPELQGAGQTGTSAEPHCCAMVCYRAGVLDDRVWPPPLASPPGGGEEHEVVREKGP